ncbi:hypothetical protein BsWGS_16347 [Bradybaena similaris]
MSTSNQLESQADEDVRGERFADAVSKYTQLLELFPADSVRWLCTRGECYLKLGEHNLALEDGKRAKNLDQTSVEASVLCGKACGRLELFTESLQHFKDCLKTDPSNKVITEELKQLQLQILKQQKECSEKDESSYSAVTLCSQSIYPGDDQLLNMEKEILEVKYKICEDEYYKEKKPKVKKDAQLESQLVQAAYECLTLERLEESLALISKVISMDPGNIFYRTFRAQVYMNMKQWAKVVQDYWIIPKPHRKPDVWKQGGKALMELWLPVLAEFWFRKATQLSGGKDEEAAFLFQKVRVRRLYDPLTQDQPVMVDFTKFGRAIFAKEHIAKGDTVLTDIPMVMAQSMTSRHVPACFNCAASMLTPEIYFRHTYFSMGEELKQLIEEYWCDVKGLSCPHCGKEKYCNKACMNEAWDSYHRVICPHFNPAAGQLYALIENNGFGNNKDGEWTELWGGHYSPMILAKIWATIVSQVRSQMEADGSTAPTLEHWARAKAPFRRFIAFGTTPAVKRMPHMLAFFQSIFADCGGGLSYPITEEEFNGRYYQAACNLQCFSPSITPYHKFMNSIKDDMRAIGMIKYLNNRPPEAQFAAMCPLHACSNHSCFNNAEVCDLDMNGRPGIQMIARRDIKKGEEICITYIDTSMPKLLRKAWLYKSFNFWCQCQRCQFEGEQANECTNCHKKAEDGKKFAACGKCKKAWYCGVACQKDAWKKGHKIICLAGHSQLKEVE